MTTPKSEGMTRRKFLTTTAAGVRLPLLLPARLREHLRPAATTALRELPPLPPPLPQT